LISHLFRIATADEKKYVNDPMPLLSPFPAALAAGMPQCEKTRFTGQTNHTQ